jgi:hypothetical protein
MSSFVTDLEKTASETNQMLNITFGSKQWAECKLFSALQN